MQKGHIWTSRSNDFEASLRAAANANHDAVHALFASHSQEVEAHQIELKKLSVLVRDGPAVAGPLCAKRCM